LDDSCKGSEGDWHPLSGREEWERAEYLIIF
jgi:hypothetical protein